ncbi:purine-nucleoside phosphorylase [Campylobacter helveticus]|uniref:phosphorylase family protein n=1 Tax=Campylobacter helveticus TaxID=28898 RepID=UPI0022EA4ACB|nr:purine-nucleoside phosphorylase [Campylobacter helveticus]
MIVCAGGNELFPFAKPIGIGLIESAMNLTKICLEFRPKKLIFIGTCGLYKNGEILGIYESSHAFNIEFSKLNHFYSPAKTEICLKKSAYKINSSNYICTDKNVALKLANLGLDVENMEAFSVLSVAENMKIEASCILCATNFCDAFAHENFLKNHQNAKEKLEETLRKKALI